MKVVFLNGYPRAGKDTFINLIKDVAHSMTDVRVASISSIDPIRHALLSIDVDIDNKTPELRALMSEVGDSLERNLGFRTKWCVKQVIRFDKATHHIVFIQMREPELIAKTIQLLADDGYAVITAFLHNNNNSPELSNQSDAGVWKENFYDREFRNDGSIDDLRAEAAKFLKSLKPALTSELKVY